MLFWGGMQKLLTALKEVPKRDLPWRHTRDPYKILVSEIMLQQTQVDRVVPFYTRFIRQFPTPAELAKAPLSKVLKAWQGLGYNRRAVYLQRSAKILSEAKVSRAGVPFISPERETFAKPIRLPGVGPYTRAAVEAFAYNKPTVFVETNIRTVFLHYCFPHKEKVSDKEILPLVEKALKKSGMQPREFYWALMDLGTLLKRQGIRLNSRSAHYTKQPKFEGSYRQLRGQILRALLEGPLTFNQLLKITVRSRKDLLPTVAGLSKEGVITLKRNKFYIAD